MPGMTGGYGGYGGGFDPSMMMGGAGPCGMIGGMCGYPQQGQQQQQQGWAQPAGGAPQWSQQSAAGYGGTPAGATAAVAKAAAQKPAAEKAATDQDRTAEFDAAVAKAVAKAQAEKSAAETASAAEKQERRDEAEQLDECLREMCGLVNAKERIEVLDAFVDPRYRVDCTPKLFSLNAEDIDTILAPLSLGTRRLVKNAWNELRLHGEAGGG